MCVCGEKGKNTVHQVYHDHEYGFPIEDDNLLFARLVLEINQAGLSWETILKKKDHFFKAYDGFDIRKVAKYTVEKKPPCCRMQGSYVTV